MLRRPALLLLLLLPFACFPAARVEPQPLAYPPARRSDLVEEHHGVKVADPYRWLEESGSEETRRWIEAQRRFTSTWLGEILCRARIGERVERLQEYDRYGLPVKRGRWYFFTRKRGLQDQPVLCRTPSASAEAEAEVVLDVNRLSADGTTALAGWSVSREGRYLAYALAQGGADWQEWRIRDLVQGRDLEEVIRWTKFTGAAWDGRERGFYYARFPAPEQGRELEQKVEGQRLFYHALGTPQEKDRLVYFRPDRKRWGYRAQVTEEGRHLVITVRQGTERKNLVFYRDLDDPGGKVIELVGEFRARFSFLGGRGGTFWFFTDHEAPRGKIIAVNLNRPEPAAWRTLVPEGEETLQGARLVGGRLAAFYLRHASSVVRLHDLEGKRIREVKGPGPGRITGFGGRWRDGETFYRFSSLNDPGTIYRHDLASGEEELFRRPLLAFDPADYQVERRFVKSFDGTRLPVFLGRRRGVEIGGGLPAILYGYGGFNISVVPDFKVLRLAWMEMGGLFVVACIRGGGEYGLDWHLAGVKRNKQNGFNDFIAAAEWLIDYGYTKKEKLAIQGASNGGLLVGACLTQRPDLFAACLPAVGVLDMLRYHRYTIGWAWASDYGKADDPEDFKVLHAYSPYHNIQPGLAYPATLITTADHDDRVVPAHSYKFAARLQQAQAGPAPILIRIAGKTGHGGGKATREAVAETRDVLAFLVRVMELDY